MSATWIFGLKMSPPLPPPFGTFPKIHPFCWHHLSLRVYNMDHWTSYDDPVMMKLWCHRKLELKYSRHRSDGLQYTSKYRPALPMRSTQIQTALIGWFTIWTFPNCKYGDPLFSLWCFLVPFKISNKCLQMSLSLLLLLLTKNLISNRHWLEHSLSDKVTFELSLDPLDDPPYCLLNG